MRKVGEGTMGTVWAARNEATSGDVALKLLARPDPDFRMRFEREARAGAVLKHRHILDVYDMGQTERGEPFLVMQLLSGEALAAMLERRRRLDPAQAARFGRDIARALAAAHAVGIVHRDLKPANVFLHNEPGEGEPFVKVLDFGVAKHLAPGDDLRTVEGTAIGSVPYMSPEQARGDADVDPRSDVWALGVLLFEMLTGVRPFRGSTQTVLAAILTGEIPSVDRYVRRIDEGLVQIVAGCMRRDRNERHASAADVAKLLEPFALAAPGPPGAWRGSAPSLPDAVAAPPSPPPHAPIRARTPAPAVVVGDPPATTADGGPLGSDPAQFETGVRGGTVVLTPAHGPLEPGATPGPAARGRIAIAIALLVGLAGAAAIVMFPGEREAPAPLSPAVTAASASPSAPPGPPPAPNPIPSAAPAPSSPDGGALDFGAAPPQPRAQPQGPDAGPLPVDPRQRPAPPKNQDIIRDPNGVGLPYSPSTI